MTTDRAAPHLRDLRGASDRPPIVLVPGIDGTAMLFHRQQPLLAHHFDTIAFPLPTVDPHTMTMGSLVDDLARLVEEISSDGAILLGESFGGALSMSTALARPELVRGLVIVNSFPYLDQRMQLRAAPLLVRAIPWGAMQIVRRVTASRLHGPHAHPDDIDDFLRCTEGIDRPSYVRRLEILRHFDLREDLHRIAAPTLFLAGDHDRLVPSVRWATEMAGSVPDSNVEILDGYGHVCMVDRDLDLSVPVARWWTDVEAAVG